MGLDIYFKKATAKQIESAGGDAQKLWNRVSTNSHRKFAAFVNKAIKPVREAYKTYKDTDDSCLPETLAPDMEDTTLGVMEFDREKRKPSKLFKPNCEYRKAYGKMLEDVKGYLKSVCGSEWNVGYYLGYLTDAKGRIFGYDLLLKAVKGMVYWFSTEDAYFRKVNLLFAYCDNYTEWGLQDDAFGFMSKGEIGELIEICKKVIDANGNEGIARQLLPTCPGFFFGSTEYDENYLYDVNHVYREMTRLYGELKDGEGCSIYFSW